MKIGKMVTDKGKILDFLKGGEGSFAGKQRRGRTLVGGQNLMEQEQGSRFIFRAKDLNLRPASLKRGREERGSNGEKKRSARKKRNPGGSAKIEDRGKR